MKSANYHLLLDLQRTIGDRSDSVSIIVNALVDLIGEVEALIQSNKTEFRIGACSEFEAFSQEEFDEMLAISETIRGESCEKEINQAPE